MVKKASWHNQDATGTSVWVPCVAVVFQTHVNLRTVHAGAGAGVRQGGFLGKKQFWLQRIDIVLVIVCSVFHTSTVPWNGI